MRKHGLAMVVLAVFMALAAAGAGIARPARAQPAEGAKAGPAEPAASALSPNEAAQAQPRAKKDRFAGVEIGKAGPKAPCPVQSREEVEVLLALRERHTVLLAKESELKQREAHLKAFEASLAERLAHVTVALANVERQLSLGAAEQAAKEQRLSALVDAVSKLSAKKAAPMLSQAEPAVVAELFQRLGPQRVSALLAVMPPATAGKLIDSAAAGPHAASKTP